MMNSKPSPVPLKELSTIRVPKKHKIYVETSACTQEQSEQMRSGGRRDLQGDASFAQKAKLLLVGFIVTCSGSWHFGWQISIINPLADILQVFITKSLESHLDTKLKKWVLHLLWPTVAGLLFIGAFCGAMISSNIIKKFGLRKSFLISSIIICTSLLMAFTSKLLFSAELLILHRFINGVGVGLITTAQTVYLAEITPIRYRGSMGTLTGFSTSIGFVVASAIGLPQCLGTESLWHWSFVLEAIPTFILLIALPTFLPISPIRLLKKGDEKEALNSLTFFQNKDAAIDQLNEFQREIHNERFKDQTEVGCIGLIRSSKNALIICLLLNATVSFSGITSVSFFGTLLLQNIGFTDQKAALANCLASFCGIIGNIVGSLTIDKIGRRILIISCLSLLALLNTIQMALVYVFQFTDDYRMGYAFLVMFMIFLFTFSLGVGPLAWFVSTELCSVEARARIQSLSISCQYITCFISSLVFLPLYHSFGPWSFLLFIFPLSICAIYLYFYLPETKNRPIDDIIDDLQRRSLLGKSNLNVQ